MTEDAVKPKAEAPLVKPVELPMAGWVKGGTTSARHDEQVARQRADAEYRRAEEDRRRALARDNPLDDVARVMQTGNAIRQREMQLGGDSYAQVVLGVKMPKESELVFLQTAELFSPMGDSELMLQMCCMRCIYRFGRTMSEAQTRIRQSHRDFSIDQRKRDQRKPNPLLGICAGDIWVNPEDPNEVITVAAMVTTHGWQTCDALGCGWQFRIDDSIIYPR